MEETHVQVQRSSISQWIVILAFMPLLFPIILVSGGMIPHSLYWEIGFGISTCITLAVFFLLFKELNEDQAVENPPSEKEAEACRLSEQLQELETKFKQLQEQHTEKEAIRLCLSEQLQGQESNLQQLREQDSKREMHIFRLSEHLKEQEAKIHQLTEQHVEKDTYAYRLSEQLQEQETKAHLLQEQHSEKEALNLRLAEQLKEQNIKLEEQCSHKEVLLNEQNAKFHLLQEQYSGKEAEVYRLLEQLQERDGKLQHLQQQYVDKEAMIQSIKEQQQAKESQLTMLQTRSAFELAEERISHKRALQDLKGQLDSVTKENRKLGKIQNNEEVSRLTKECEAFSQQLQDLQLSLKNAEEQILEELRQKRHAEGLYTQLREQFSEKTSLLEQTRQQLFLAEEAYDSLQRKWHEAKLYDYSKEEKLLTKHILRMEKEFSETLQTYQREIDLLNDLIRREYHNVSIETLSLQNA